MCFRLGYLLLASLRVKIPKSSHASIGVRRNTFDYFSKLEIDKRLQGADLGNGGNFPLPGNNLPY